MKDNTPAQKIIEAIDKGKVAMKPRWHFVARSILFGVGLTLAIITTIYIASFAMFVLKQTGIWFIPSFGGFGWYILLGRLPWTLIVVSIIFMGVVELFVKKYTLGYRYPLLYSALGVIVIALIGSSIIDQTKIHSKIFSFAKDGNMPIAGGLYKEYGMKRPPDIQIGTIIEITDYGFVLEDPRAEVMQISTSSKTRFPLGYDFVIGDRVVVFGEKDQTSKVNALGVKKIDKEFGPDIKIKMMKNKKLIPPPPSF